MKVRVFADQSINLDLPTIVTNLNGITESIAWHLGKTSFRVEEGHIEFPGTYEKLSPKLVSETKDDLLAVLFTEKPYDNNYFWESVEGNLVIVSLYGWEHLTTLPRNNGAVYFLAALLVRRLGIGDSHRAKNTGCINDFWQDKTGVDAGMRSAFLCSKCLPSKKSTGNTQSALAISDIQKILDDLSLSSRANEDICDHWNRKASDDRFDVFLCHNSQDKPTIRLINEDLKNSAIRTWLDEEQLPPGRAWQELLEQQIESITTVAVFVGESSTGPWQDVEIRAFLSEFVSRRCPVIPVILSECKTVPQLPLFLRQFTWVDFRKDVPPPLKQLLWGITGQKPAHDVRSNKALQGTRQKRRAPDRKRWVPYCHRAC